MTLLSILHDSRPPFAALTLDDLLAKMQRVGKPRLGFNTGWYCAVDVTMPVRGNDYTIRSEWELPTPYAAAKQCAERVEKALFGRPTSS